MKKFIKNFGIVLGIITLNIANAQDYHFSQYDVAPQLLNPALTGLLHKKEMHATVQHRNQWSNLNANYTTSTFSFDTRFDRHIGVGAYFLTHDGAKGLNKTHVVVSGSYDITDPNQEKHHINMGLQLGAIRLKVKDEFIFNEQYDEVTNTFDEYLGNGESGLRSSKMLPEVNIGFAYVNTNIRKKFRPYGGFSLFHVTNPNQSLLSEKSKLPLRYTVNFGANYVHEQIHYIEPKFVFMYQRKAMMIMGGLLYTYNIEHMGLKIKGGANYRHGDAVIPVLGMEYYSYELVFSYDINTSGLKEYSNGQGAFEITLGFKGVMQPHKKAGNASKRPYI